MGSWGGWTHRAQPGGDLAFSLSERQTQCWILTRGVTGCHLKGKDHSAVIQISDENRSKMTCDMFRRLAKTHEKERWFR